MCPSTKLMFEHIGIQKLQILCCFKQTKRDLVLEKDFNAVVISLRFYKMAQELVHNK
jgi:hypothetical protein